MLFKHLVVNLVGLFIFAVLRQPGDQDVEVELVHSQTGLCVNKLVKLHGFLELLVLKHAQDVGRITDDVLILYGVKDLLGHFKLLAFQCTGQVSVEGHNVRLLLSLIHLL